MFTERTISMYSRFNSLSIRFYAPGIIANLPHRNHKSRYCHGGHTREEIQSHFPWAVEIVGPDGQPGFDFEVSEPERHINSKSLDQERGVSK
jgi:hypothetical protein